MSPAVATAMASGWPLWQVLVATKRLREPGLGGGTAVTQCSVSHTAMQCNGVQKRWMNHTVLCACACVGGCAWVRECAWVCGCCVGVGVGVGVLRARGCVARACVCGPIAADLMPPPPSYTAVARFVRCGVSMLVALVLHVRCGGRRSLTSGATGCN